MKALVACLIVAATFAGIVAVHGASGDELVTRDVFLMGTRARLLTYAVDRPSGLTGLSSMLASLEATEAELSTWRQDSAISRVNRAPLGVTTPLAERLCSMFREIDDWHRASGGTFDPAIGALIDAWDIHGAGRVPSPRELADARRRSGLSLLDLGPDCALTRRGDLTLDVGGFGKGEAIDRAGRLLAGHAWMIDLGGQVAVGGSKPGGEPWVVDIAHPHDRERPVLRVHLTGGSLSTSGGSERDLAVGATRVGHILDPRTGWPAPFLGSVSVWHERGLAADILSTALYVMGPDDGLRWANERGLAAAFLWEEGQGLRMRVTPVFERLIGRE